jgi:hypothetical protein
MDAWGDKVEAQFEGDWEDKMESWEEAMEAWGEAVEEIVESEDFVEFAELSALSSLEALGDLDGLASLSALAAIESLDLEDLGNRTGETSEEIRDRIRTSVEAGLRQALNADSRRETVERQIERQVEREVARAEREIERAQRDIERAERAERYAERDKRYAERDAERAERMAERARHQAERDAHAEHKRQYGRAHSRHVISFDGDNTGKRVVINGRTLKVDDFAERLRTELVKDGLITNQKTNVKVELCFDKFTVNGKAASKAQAKRYAQMFKAAGIDSDDSTTVIMKKDALKITLSGHGKKDVQTVTGGTHSHDDKK